MLSKCQENALNGRKPYLKSLSDCFIDGSETLVFARAMRLDFPYGGRLGCVQQMLVLDQVMIQLLSGPNSSLKFESAAVFRLRKYSKSWELIYEGH
jgi:hypothetical protein